MNKIKLFVSSDSEVMEDKINEFLSSNPDIEIMNLFATEVVINPNSDLDNCAYMTVYLLYSILLG